MKFKEELNKELGINLKTPISDEQILEWLTEERAVENLDCPPYDPKSGL